MAVELSTMLLDSNADITRADKRGFTVSRYIPVRVGGARKGRSVRFVFEFVLIVPLLLELLFLWL